MYGIVLQKLGTSYDPTKIKGSYSPNSQTELTMTHRPDGKFGAMMNVALTNDVRVH